MDADGYIFYLEQRVTDLPDNDNWLSSVERSILGSLRVPKRRSDWRLGRWTSKCVVSAYLGWSRKRLRDIGIRSLPSGAPEVTVLGCRLTPEISISHSCDACMCVVGSPGARIGCDIEKVEVRSQAFIETFFTSDEVAAVTALSTKERDILANIIWSTKESYLKATREGLGRDTRDVSASAPETSAWRRGTLGRPAWLPVWISDCRKRSVAYWRIAEGFIETVCRPGAAIVSITDVLANSGRWPRPEICARQ